MVAQVKILGINDDVTTCECCGRAGLKKTVVLEIDEAVVHYGCDCAARKLLGTNKNGNAAAVEKMGLAVEYARTWLGKTPAHTAAVVANAIRVRFAPCHVVGEFSVSFNNGVVISA